MTTTPGFGRHDGSLAELGAIKETDPMADTHQDTTIPASAPFLDPNEAISILRRMLDRGYHFRPDETRAIDSAIIALEVCRMAAKENC